MIKSAWRRWLKAIAASWFAALTLACGIAGAPETGANEPDGGNARPPASDANLRYWLENMIWHHRFTMDEVSAATDLTVEEIRSAVEKWDIRPETAPAGAGKSGANRLRVLPYPGGRHPRIGFLEGAIDPQRETKVSVFTPWTEDDAAPGYVVVDVPEAIRWQHGILYLAHTHVDTAWTLKGITLPPLEWERHKDGRLTLQRALPNKVTFRSEITPARDHVDMRLTLTNGSDETLTDMRVQNCVMLKSAPGFTAQTRENKLFRAPFAAAHSEDGKRWIITAWEPCLRPWGNDQVPCLHSDPQFPDCAPGETVEVRGWLSFYEAAGADGIEAELDRILAAWDRE